MQKNFDDLAAIVRQFCEERDWDQFHGPKDLAIGIITEASELLELFRFKSEEDVQQMMNDAKKREAIGEELADVLYFVLHRLGDSIRSPWGERFSWSEVVMDER